MHSRFLTGWSGRTTAAAVVGLALLTWTSVSAAPPTKQGSAGASTGLAKSTPQDELVRAEAMEILYRLLDQLPAERRSVFVMAELEEMSASEIAEAARLPLNTVYSRLRLARRDFEAALKRLRVREEWKFR